MLTDQQQKFLELTKKVEELKNSLYKELYPQLDSLMNELGVGSHLQDPETGVVYEIVVPNGTFIPYKTISYNRTKVGDEKRPTLSKSRAQELGYTL